jgi:hypothetical protein
MGRTSGDQEDDMDTPSLTLNLKRDEQAGIVSVDNSMAWKLLGFERSNISEVTNTEIILCVNLIAYGGA